MNDRHPNAPGHDPQTGEIDDEAVIGEIIDPMGTGVLATLHRVEIDQQIATAKAYPRNVTKIKQELTALVTMDEDTADDCIYALPRGKKHIKGPSARFADALISFWGNARSGAFITQVDRENKFVEAIGSFQDVERNVIRQRRVRRPISSHDGRLYNADMINMTGNAACVIAERNAILNGIPKSLWGPAYEQAFALVAGTVKTLDEKLKRAEKHFGAMGISMDQVLEKLQRTDLTKVIPDDIVTMRGMLTALKTGEETVETIFGRGAGQAQHETVQNPLKDDPISTGLKTVDRINHDAGIKQVDPPADISEKLAERSETASNEAAKTDMGSQGSEKPAEQGQTESAVNGQSSQTTARSPAAGQQASPYEQTADGYTGYMHDQFDKATSKAAIKETWASTRDDRMALLNAEELGELEKDRDAALKRIDLKKGGGV
jgi:hypothetical protein